MRCVLLLLLAGLPLLAKENALSTAESADGWLLLFDGATGMGWSQGKTAGWRIADSSFIYDAQQPGMLSSATPFADFVLRFEFKTAHPEKTPGLLIRYATSDTPQDSGYPVKLGSDDAKWPAGSIVGVAKADPAPLAANQWHAVEVEAMGDSLRVSIDGRKVASGKDQRGKAGFLAFNGKPGESMQIRNLKLKPEGWQNLFNGSDLSNWRAVSPPPPKPAGGLKKLLKMGTAKPKEAQWLVQSGSMHAEGGAGELQTQTLHGDFLVQVQARPSNVGKEPEASLRLRADAGKWATGYAVDLLPGDTGALLGFKPPRPSTVGGNMFLETIAATGRHFLIWVNGYPVTEFEDTRPEGQPIDKGAKSSAGAIAFATNTTLDVAAVKAVDLPAVLGVQKAAAVAAPVVPPVSTPPAAAVQATPPAVQIPGLTPQQQEDAKTKEQVRQLTAQALAESDPAKLAGIYGQILQADPDNAFAASGIRDARAKLDQAAEEKRKAVEQEAQQQQKTDTNAAQGQAAFQKAESAFTAGDLTTAAGSITVAKRFLPNDPEVEKLRLGIDRATKTRQRLQILAGVGGLAALVGAALLLFRIRGKKIPVLIVVDGFDKGKKFRLDGEITHIGAIAQDGNARNEIVLKDVDRMISRFHCEIFNKNGKLFLIDVGSANGTFVNGKKIAAKKPVALKNGGRFSLAQVCEVAVERERGT